MTIEERLAAVNVIMEGLQKHVDKLYESVLEGSNDARPGSYTLADNYSAARAIREKLEMLDYFCSEKSFIELQMKNQVGEG